MHPFQPGGWREAGAVIRVDARQHFWKPERGDKGIASDVAVILVRRLSTGVALVEIAFFLLGISNTIATIPGIAGVAITGWLVEATGN